MKASCENILIQKSLNQITFYSKSAKPASKYIIFTKIKWDWLSFELILLKYSLLNLGRHHRGQRWKRTCGLYHLYLLATSPETSSLAVSAQKIWCHHGSSLHWPRSGWLMFMRCHFGEGAPGEVVITCVHLPQKGQPRHNIWRSEWCRRNMGVTFLQGGQVHVAIINGLATAQMGAT